MSASLRPEVASVAVGSAASAVGSAAAAYAVAGALLLLPAMPARAACPDPGLWPDGGWTSRAEAVAAARPEAVAALEDYAFTLTGEPADRAGIRSEGVLVIHQGEIVYENYGLGFGPDNRHLLWSVSKSFISALVGTAVDRGALALEDSICDHVVVQNPDACAVTVEDLMEFASGFDWNETYEGQSNQHSSVLSMLYGMGQPDMVSFVSSHPLRDAPGTTFSYSSGETTLLTGVLHAALTPTQGEDWPWRLLFEPIGLGSATWERDGKGVPVGSSYLYTTPRDLARFGYLVLNDGCWSGGRVLPEGWVQYMTSVTEPFRTEPLNIDPDEDVQGRQWWLNRPVPEQGIASPWPSVPEDAFAARGHWGQSLTVIPSLDLLVVRTGDDREREFDLDTFLSLVLPLVE